VSQERKHVVGRNMRPKLLSVREGSFLNPALPFAAHVGLTL